MLEQNNAFGPFQEKDIHPFCRSKAEEFESLGYRDIEPEDIWQFVSKDYGDDYPRFHKVVNDILTLKVTDFMNWITLNAYKGTMYTDPSDPFASD